MSESPPKRRKISETESLPGRRPEVTHRTSFQSPTRASLARSHPEVLSRVLSRSPSRSPQRPVSGHDEEQRQQDEVIGLRNRKALRPSLNAPGSPSRLSGSFPARSPTRRASGAFAAPPRRVSRRLFTPEIEPSEATRTLSRRNDPDEGSGPKQRGPTEERSAEDDRISERSSSSSGDSGEPELPPTPTGLGRVRLRGRPSLSSPSMRQERSKLRREIRQAEDAQTRNAAREDIPEELREKLELKEELSAQLERLKADVSRLEHLAKKAEQPSDSFEPDVQDMISLLTATNSLSASPSPTPEAPPVSTLLSSLLPFSSRAVSEIPRATSPDPANPFALPEVEDPKPYLTVFAPLQLSHSTKVSTNSQSRLIETHDLTLSPSFPFPRSAYRVPLRFTTDLESQQVISISIPQRGDGQKARIPQPLNQWMTNRLENPLLRLDIAGLCWGINRYWEAAVSRARLWARLKNRDTNSSTTSLQSKAELRAILPHLDRTSMLLTPRSPSRISILFSCTLSLDPWTSEVALEPGISVSLPPTQADGSTVAKRTAKIERDIKRLFHGLIKAGIAGGNEFDRIVDGVEGVLGCFDA